MSSDDDGGRGQEPRLRDIARRFLSDDADRPGINPREVLGAVIDGGDKAKSEVVRMVAREVRTYLEGMGLGDDIRHMMTNYSLDVNASFSLKPLAKAMEAVGEE
jgi:hypothetical protein